MKSSIDSALTGNVALTLRSRLKCVLGTTDKSSGLRVKDLESSPVPHKLQSAEQLVSYSVSVHRPSHISLIRYSLYAT